MSRKDTIPSPDSIPGFTLNYRIGQGGMGAVFHATQNSLNRPVAIKVLTSRLSDEHGMVSRFEREAEALGRLNHPNIVRVIERGVARGGLHYFAMEFVDGPSLRSIMRRPEVLSRDDFRRMVHEVCDALQYIHGQGIVHRDIKPGNILRDESGRFRLADFGLIHVVKSASATLTMPTARRGSRSEGASVVGTPMYLAPEQLHPSEAITASADIYSLGVVCYELIAGALPLGRFKAPSELNHTADQAMDAPLLQALSRDPAERFGLAREFERAMLHGIDASHRLRLRPSRRAVEEGASAVDRADLNLAARASSGGRRLDSRSDASRSRRRAAAFGGAAALTAVLLAALWLAWPDPGRSTSRASAGAALLPPDEGISWKLDYGEALRLAERTGRPVLAALIDGPEGARDIVLGPAARDVVEASFVPFLGDVSRDAELRDRFSPATLPLVLALDATGREIVVESAWPVMEEGGLAGFLNRALELSKPFNAWSADLESALKRARALGGQPILLLAACGREKREIRPFKERIAGDPRLAEACDGMVLLSLEKESDHELITTEYGLIAFPILFLVDSKTNTMIGEEPMRFPPHSDEALADWLLSLRKP